MSVGDRTYLANLGGRVTLGGHFRSPAGSDWVLSKRTRILFNKFYYIRGGTCTITVDGCEYIGRAGDLFFIPAGSWHTYADRHDEVFEKDWMHFELTPDNGLFAALSLPHRVHAPAGSRVSSLFRRYVRLSRGAGAREEIAVKAILLDLISEYIALAYPEGVMPGGEERMIMRVLAYIGAHLSEPMSVSSLAARFYLHPNHFIRFFKSETGQTPARYIRNARMEIAKRALEESDRPIREIMAMIGEEDAFAFSKRFKGYCSYSPREYRKAFSKKQGK